MDIKKKIIISGQKVHDVGYRPYLLGIAESIGVEMFFVDNIFSDEKQVVYVLINSSRENVDSFIEIASSKFPEKSIVEKVEVEEYKGNVMKIESFYRYLTAMQLSKIANYGGKLLDKQDKMLDKQDFHIEVTRNGFNDLKDEMTEIKDEIKGTRDEIKGTRDEIKGTRDEIKYELQGMRSDMNAGFAGIKKEIHMQRDDFKEVFMKEVEGLHNEINEIRATLARIQHGQEA
ncbi:MAG: acylphosphatase [Candidatus Methanoperedens sp.]|nr:acylphosphatase [Candidatus Methanoperedens sp.]